MICPVKTSKEWKDLMDRVGSENIAFHIWNKLDGNITSEKVNDTIKDMSMKLSEPITSVEKNIRQGVTNNVLDMIVGKIRKSVPNIDIRFVTDKDALESVPGYINKGVIYLNTDRVTPGTPFHEITHLLVDIMEKVNPNAYGEFFNQAREMVKSGEIVQQIALKQPHLNQKDAIKETIATISGFNSEEKVKDYWMKNKLGDDKSAISFWEKTKDTIKDMWDRLKAYLGNIFGIQPDYMKNIDLQNMTITQFSDHIVNGVLDGKILSYMSSENYNALSNGKFWKSTGDIKNTWQTTADLDKLSGIDLDIKRRKREEAFGREVWEKNPNEAFTKYYNKKGTRAEIFPGKTVGDVTFLSSITDSDLSKVSQAIGEATGRKREIMSLRDFVEKSNIPPAFLSYFNGINPMITVDADFKDGRKQISIYNMVTDNIRKARVEMDNKNLLASFGFTDFVSKYKGINIYNTVGSISNLQMVLMANKLMKDNPKIQVNEMKTIGVGERNKNVNVSVVDHPNIDRNIEVLSKIPEFMSMIKKQSIGLYDAFTNPEYIKQQSGNKYIPDQLKSFYDNQKQEIMKGMIPTGKYDEILPVFGDNMLDDPVRTLEYIEHRIKMLNDRTSNISIADPNDVYERNMLMDWDKSLRKVGAQMVFTSFNKFNDIGNFQKWASDIPSIGNENVQYIYGIVDTLQKKVINTFRDSLQWYFGDKSKDGFIWKYRKGGTHLTPEDIYVFDKLYHFQEVENPNTHIKKNVFTGHFYYTDRVTDNMTATEKLLANAAKKKKISKEDLKQGEILKNFMDNQMIDAWIHQQNGRLDIEVSGNRMKGYFIDEVNANKPEIRDKILKELKENRGYSSGMLPLIEMIPSESLFKGHPLDFINKAIKVTSSVYSTFEEMGEKSTEGDKSLSKMKERFLHQMLSSEANYNNSLGNDVRLRRLGLERKEDRLGNEFYQLAEKGEDRNNRISRNLTSMLTYFTMNNIRNRIYEDQLLPLVYGTKQALEALQKHSDMTTTQVRSFIDMYTMQGIEGERKKFDTMKTGIDLDKAGMVASRFAIGLTMPFNVNVAAITLITNGVRALNEGIAHTITGWLTKEEQHYFGANHLIKASALLMGGDYNKIVQLALHYNVIKSELRDLLQDRMRTGQKYVLDDYWGGWMMFGADLMARCTVMAAQMLKEGTYNAHIYDPKTGTITYKPELDKSIYLSKGKYNPQGGKEKEAYLMESLKIDGTMPKESKILTHAYTAKDARIFNYLAMKYVIGSYGEKIKPLFGSILIGKMYGLFKAYFMQMANNAVQPLEQIESGGWTTFEKDAAGNYVPLIHRQMVEGYSRMIFRRLGELVALRSFSEMKKLQPFEIYNISKVVSMLASFLAMHYLYANMVDQDEGRMVGPDEVRDDDNNKIPNYRFVQSWHYAYRSLFVVGMLDEIQKSPFAAMNIIFNQFTRLYGIQGIGTRPFQYPGRSVKQMIEQVAAGKSAIELGREKAKETRRERKEEGEEE